LYPELLQAFSKAGWCTYKDFFFFFKLTPGRLECNSGQTASDQRSISLTSW